MPVSANAEIDISINMFFLQVTFDPVNQWIIYVKHIMYSSINVIQFDDVESLYTFAVQSYNKKAEYGRK